MTKLKRSEVARCLKDAAASWLLRQGCSTFEELGLESWGHKRADVIGINLKGRITIVEVKSCWADFHNDSKWRTYLPYCHRFYFLVPQFLVERVRPEVADVGLIYLNEQTGYVSSSRPCRQFEMDPMRHLSLVYRMAWRNGKSKRTSRRVRRFLGEPNDS